MTELGVTRKFSFGPSSFRSVDLHDVINVDDPNNNEAVIEAFQLSIERLEAVWAWYRDLIEEKNGVSLPTY